ncbi:MAG: YciI family protein [Chthoniobacteraceae bacterium]
MTTPSSKSEFLLLFRNTQLEKRLSMDEMQEAMRRLNEWIEGWTKRGNITAGQPLDDEGKVISGAKNQRSVADGPFAESKEAVGGYVFVQAESFEEAMQVAADWPLLDYDAAVEVRPVRTQCATMEMIGGQLARAGA